MCFQHVYMPVSTFSLFTVLFQLFRHCFYHLCLRRDQGKLLCAWSCLIIPQLPYTWACSSKIPSCLFHFYSLWPSLLIQFICLWQGGKDVGRKFLSQSLLNLFRISVLYFIQDKGQQSPSAKSHSPLVKGDTYRKELGMKTNLITGISQSFEPSSQLRWKSYSSSRRCTCNAHSEYQDQCIYMCVCIYAAVSTCS